mmetsp:Transcript_8700/g.19800  ORF Transcript_8700/g.19800 Transcript_8700/m.19800 type:complete len:235 (-) Transcript_8700:955-1659(-)
MTSWSSRLFLWTSFILSFCACTAFSVSRTLVTRNSFTASTLFKFATASSFSALHLAASASHLCSFSRIRNMMDSSAWESFSAMFIAIAVLNFISELSVAMELAELVPFVVAAVLGVTLAGSCCELIASAEPPNHDETWENGLATPDLAVPALLAVAADAFEPWRLCVGRVAGDVTGSRAGDDLGDAFGGLEGVDASVIFLSLSFAVPITVFLGDGGGNEGRDSVVTDCTCGVDT